MSSERLLSKQEVAKIIKHEFDRWLESKDPAFSRCNELYCVLSPKGFLSVVPVISQNDIVILSFNRETSGDVMPMERVLRVIDNDWWNLQHIQRTEYYEKLLDKIDGND